MPSNSGCRGDGKINDFVADEKATGQVDRPVLQQIEKHTGSRLAPVARSAVGRIGRVRIVIVDRFGTSEKWRNIAKRDFFEIVFYRISRCAPRLAR